MSDYYALAGIFKSTRTMLSHRVDSKWNATGLGEIQAALRLDDLEQIIDRHDNLLVNGNPDRMGAGAFARLTPSCSKTAKREYAAIPKAMAVVEGTPGDLEIFLRGNHLTRGPIVPRRFPAILAGRRPAAIDPKHSGRLELARWLTRAEPSAHGAGDRQPRLAMAFRPGPRRLGRQLRQAGAASHSSRAARLAGEPARRGGLVAQDAAQGDHALAGLSDEHAMESSRPPRSIPRTALLWRMPRRRMEAEELRDSILAVGGLLDPTMGGTLLPTTPVPGPFGRRLVAQPGAL